MRILIVSPMLPAPVSGGRTRVYNLTKALSARHSISVVAFIQPTERDLLPALDAYCEHIEPVPFAGFEPLGKWRNRLDGWSHILLGSRPRYATTFPVDAMRRPLLDLLDAHQFDVILFEQLFLAELLDAVDDTPAVLVEQNVESDLLRQRFANANNVVHRLRDWLMWRKLVAFERHWVRRFPVCVAVSDHDAAILRQMSPRTDVHVVPNGVDTHAFAPSDDHRDERRLLFFGSLRYGPNVDGLIWFCREVLPLIREARPTVHLEVVGLSPGPKVTALGDLAGVRITGFVPDIRPKLWSATLSVVPLLLGGGTRLKILEALAAGCPVVSTTVGAEGLHLVNGRHLLIADTASAFADAIECLLQSPARRDELRTNGRRVVRKKYDWQSIAVSLEAACEAAIGRQSAGAGAHKPAEGCSSVALPEGEREDIL